MRSKYCSTALLLLPFMAANSPRLGMTAESEQAAFSVPVMMDAGGQPFDGAAHQYTLTFAADDLPPARDWSLELYGLPRQDFVENAIHRHAIESQMLPELVRGNDGSITIYIQREPPQGKLTANWLPAADGPFMMQLRLKSPRQAMLNAKWEVPPVERVE